MMNASPESVAERLDRASRIAKRNLVVPPLSRPSRKERKHRALFQQVDELLAKHIHRNSSSDSSTAVTENASFYSHGSSECHLPLHIEQQQKPRTLRLPPEEDVVSRQSSDESVPIDVDTMQEYHADDETLVTMETTRQQQEFEIQFDQMSLQQRPRPQRGGGSARGGDANSCHTGSSRPVSCDDSGPIDVDTGAFVDIEEEEEEEGDDDCIVPDIVIDETEMSQGLVGYMEGFEPPVVRYRDLFELLEEDSSEKIDASVLYEV